MTIRALFIALMFFSLDLALNDGGAFAKCRWDGTGPFCAGECGDNETETMRLSSGNGTQRIEATNTFGSDCLTGNKALCCESRGRTCRWDGTAPFCAGECKSNEKQAQPPEGSGSGASCVTGSKVYCCLVTTNPNPGSTRQALQESPAYSHFAAIWEKSGGPAWQARHGLNGQQYQQAFNDLTQQGYRLIDVSGYAVGPQDYYAAIWEKSDGPEWQARHGLTADQYQQAFNQLAQQGFRLVHVDGYAVNGQDRYAGIWQKSGGPAWEARHGLTSAQYQQEFDRLTRQGYRLVDVSGYWVGGQDRYAAIWEKSDGPAWQARHGLTSEQYQQAFNQLAQEGYRLVKVRGWGSGDTYRYAAIWEKTTGPDWYARHGMLADGYQEEFDRLLKAGYRLKDVSGYQAVAN